MSASASLRRIKRGFAYGGEAAQRKSSHELETALDALIDVVETAEALVEWDGSLQLEEALARLKAVLREGD